MAGLYNFDIWHTSQYLPSPENSNPSRREGWYYWCEPDVWTVVGPFSTSNDAVKAIEAEIEQFESALAGEC